MTVKLRPGQRPGDDDGLVLARRLADEADVAGIAFHPRHASQQHAGSPDYALARRLVESLPVPVLLSGGLSSEERVLRVPESGAEAVMLARGSLGNPWRFARLVGRGDGEPSPAEVARELLWVIARAEEHLGLERAGRYLRKFYPLVCRHARARQARAGAARDRSDYRARPRADSPAGRRGAGVGGLSWLPLERAHRSGAGRHVARLPRPSGESMRGGFLMARETVLTPDGLVELKAKIEHLRTVRRREVAERIKEAREFGDISENSEYDDAKNEQAMLEKQISDLEEKLRNARVIDEKEVDTDVVSVGVTVHVKDQKNDKSTKYKIVGSAEAGPLRQQALERVAGRQGPARPQARRDRHGLGAARPARKLKITKIERA